MRTKHLHECLEKPEVGDAGELRVKWPGKFVAPLVRCEKDGVVDPDLAHDVEVRIFLLDYRAPLGKEAVIRIGKGVLPDAVQSR